METIRLTQKFITRRVLIARRLVVISHHVNLSRMGDRKESPTGADIKISLGCCTVDKFRMQNSSATPFNSSGEVQSELFTEENTCMTSS